MRVFAGSEALASMICADMAEVICNGPHCKRPALTCSVTGFTLFPGKPLCGQVFP